MRVKTFARAGPPRADRLAGAAHVVGVGRIADQLERVIGLHARAHVEGALVEQRPAAMRALHAAQVDRDLALELGVDRLGEKVTHQDVFGRDGAVGLELEDPMTIRLLAVEQRLCRGLNVLFQSGIAAVGHYRYDYVHRWPRLIASAARCPDRMALSIVAGKPVFVQSPASMRLFQAVRAPGRRASCSGVAAKVARRSRTICHGGSSAGRRAMVRTSRQMVCASASRGVSRSRSPALMVVEMRPGKVKIHSVVALMT